jgi:hypothetical protein
MPAPRKGRENLAHLQCAVRLGGHQTFHIWLSSVGIFDAKRMEAIAVGGAFFAQPTESRKTIGARQGGSRIYEVVSGVKHFLDRAPPDRQKAAISAQARSGVSMMTRGRNLSSMTFFCFDRRASPI